MFELLQTDPEKVTQMFSQDDDEDEDYEDDGLSVLERVKEATLTGAEYTGIAVRKGFTPAASILLAAVFVYYVITFVSVQNKTPVFKPPVAPPQDISELSARLQRLESELSRVGSDAGSSSEWISINKEIIKKLPSQVESVEKALGGIDQQADKLSQSMERITKDTKFLLTDNSAFSSTQKKWVSELESLKQQLIKQREAINAIKSNEMDTTPALAMLGGTVERIDGDLTRLASDLEKRQKLDTAHISQLVSDAVKKAVPKDQPNFYEDAKTKLEEYIAAVVPEIKAEVLEIVASIPNHATNDTVDFSSLISQAVAQKVAELDLESLFVAPEDLKTTLDKEIGQVKSFVETKVQEVETKVKEVKTNVADVKSDVAQVEQKVVKIQSDITHIETEVAQVEANKTVTAPRGDVSDKIINFAALVNGAEIDKEHTTELYDPWKDRNPVYWAFRNGLSTVGVGKPLVRRPWVALMADVSCWPFNGQRGQLAVRLAAKMKPTSFSIRHSVASGYPYFNSAPRFFNIWIRVDDAKLREQLNPATETFRPHNIPKNFMLVGQYEFEPAETSNAFYPIPQKMKQLDIETEEAIFEFVENWGHDKFTCVYQVGVHGIQAPEEEVKEVEEEEVEIEEDSEDGSQSIMYNM